MEQINCALDICKWFRELPEITEEENKSFRENEIGYWFYTTAQSPIPKMVIMTGTINGKHAIVFEKVLSIPEGDSFVSKVVSKVYYPEEVKTHFHSESPNNYVSAILVDNLFWVREEVVEYSKTVLGMDMDTIKHLEFSTWY